ncbi:MAG: GDSL family lipase [Rhodospirillales bacterium]|nr:GDSL family lipase [Rhodospirillales bacterium]
MMTAPHMRGVAGRAMPEWFDQEVSELERRSRARRDVRNPIMLYGSSSFTLWNDVQAYLPGYNLLNHGFGGATLADCVEYFDRLVVPFAPRIVILYAGDNDLGDGGQPETVLARLRSFIARKRETLGDVPMAYVSIKISPARFAIMHRIAYTNRIIERELRNAPDVRYLDIMRRMVGRGIEPFLAYYTEDPLHMNRKGYRVLGRTLSEYLIDMERAHGNLRSSPPTSAQAPMQAPMPEALTSPQPVST